MIPQETVNLILDTARIEEVVSDYVTLKRRGASLVACCPFHNEKTPSFYVTPSKSIYKCFGCGKAGSAVQFVMEMEHCTYVEALRYLARKYNIEIQEHEETPEEIAQRQYGESLLLASEFACKFFSDQLTQSPEGKAVGLNYYRSRGISDETIARFGLGWAPSGRTAFVDFAKAAGYKVEHLVDAGLAVRHEDGTVTDKFRERVMFPIHSVSGRVIAFSGRTLHADNPAKYVNSPETRIYVKSRNLLGIYFAKSEIARLDNCILVEGNVDMVMMHQLGIRNVVASCGTSLTKEQIQLIHRFTENITIMYDGDSAGIHAALRGTDMILEEGMNVKIVLLPDGEDPDSFSRSRTLAQVQDFIRQSERDFVIFKTDLLLGEASNDPLKKANLINDIADTIAKIPDAVKRTTYVQATAMKFGIEADILFNRISNVRRKLKDEAAQARYREERRARHYDVQEPGPAVMDDFPPVVPEQPSVWMPENRTVAIEEQDLLKFIIGYGCNELHFPTDSKYYDKDADQNMTVFEFIRASLEEDGAEMLNTVYNEIYRQYMQMYDAGSLHGDIVASLLNSPDRNVAVVTAQLATQKYQLTIQAFEDALTATSSWLVNQVPKAILVYNERRLQCHIDKILEQLKYSPANEEALMMKLMKLRETQLKIKKLVGRDKRFE